MLMGMGLIGWVVSVVLGFVVGGIFFLSMKLQVEYVVEKRGPTWLLPAALYGRLLLVGAVLVVVAWLVPAQKLAAAMLAGMAGMLIARVLVSRTVRKGSAEPVEEPDGE